MQLLRKCISDIFLIVKPALLCTNTPVELSQKTIKKCTFICCEGTRENVIAIGKPLSNVTRLARSVGPVALDDAIQLVHYEGRIEAGYRGKHTVNSMQDPRKSEYNNSSMGNSWMNSI